MEANLESLPAELLNTYENFFDRVALGRDKKADKRMRLCLQRIATSATPVTTADVKIYWLVHAETGKEKFTDDSLGDLLEKTPKRES